MKRGINMQDNVKLKKSIFPLKIFFATLGNVLLTVGIHMGIVQFFLLDIFNSASWNGWIQTAIVMLYWLLISFAFTLFTTSQVKKEYENPMKELAKATNAVAHGDFSVYMPQVHSADKLDYVDVMISDFNSMVEELGSVETLKTDSYPMYLMK